MTKTFQVSIYTREQTLYAGEAVSLIVPGEFGYLGVLAGHAPLVVRLSGGKITIRVPGGDMRVIDSASGGFLQVLQDQATVLL